MEKTKKLTKDDYMFDFRKAHIYGLGSLLGIYLYQNHNLITIPELKNVGIDFSA